MVTSDSERKTSKNEDKLSSPSISAKFNRNKIAKNVTLDGVSVSKRNVPIFLTDSIRFHVTSCTVVIVTDSV